MRRWLRGKGGCFLGLLAIAGLVVGGLGWVTAQALHLQEQQRETLAAKELSQAETDQAHKLRLALWRLDTRVYADMGYEASRPYHEYAAQAAVVPAWAKNNDQSKALTVLELEPLLTRGDDAPAWMGNGYLVGLEADWKAPQMFCDDLARHLNVARPKSQANKKSSDEDPALAAINRTELFPEYLQQVRKQEAEQQTGQGVFVPQPNPNPLAQQPGQTNFRDNRVDPGRGQEATQNMQQLQGGPGRRGNYDPDTMLRMMRVGSDKAVPAYGNTTQTPAGPPDNNRPRDDKQPVIILGPMTPLWLTGEGDPRLVVARLVQIGHKPACQVTVLNWPVLEAELLGLVRDLLPEARLEPELARDDEAPPERAMTALPVKLDPGPIRVQTAGWDGSSLRYGLALAWAAALVGLLAVALGGWALLDLSERRIRFVSAVTHELRTPLTSLRLYLDMLTSGLVTDEKRKDEYLHTLNAETDRLNRLVGNVLDFSRLENQRPKLSLGYVTVSDLLYQVRATWEGRCHDAGKHLVLENAAGEDALLHTDEQLVQQVLGNLIDNACKYSRSAEDARLHVRARAEAGRLVLEVEDHGPGIPARERHSVFRAFRRGCGADETAGGVGLGLALAQRWAGLLGGTVTLAAEGQGACFRVVLPGLAE